MSDLVCFSHLRWGFVFQRPNHLMSRAAKTHRVFFVEEAARQERIEAIMPQLTVITPGPSTVIDDVLASFGVRSPVLWFYTPMMLPLARNLKARAVVYDCMDELSAFLHAPPLLIERERALFDRADLVFTGGHSLFEAKRHKHRSVHAFPSSVDVAHFAQARHALGEPPDQAPVGHPRLGFFGVIDERMDLALVDALARSRPRWQMVMIGPVVKIAPEILPRRRNIHWLGAKTYDELPAYLQGWDVALMPFALNAATRFISPTKTLEYLAAGKPVVSTAIVDVVTPYGEQGIVRIADAGTFVAAVEDALRQPDKNQAAASLLLAQTSWDRTWGEMATKIEEVITCTTISS